MLKSPETSKSLPSTKRLVLGLNWGHRRLSSIPEEEEVDPNKYDAGILSAQHKAQGDSETIPEKVKSESRFPLTPFLLLASPVY